jgi:hypothetical protein
MFLFASTAMERGELKVAESALPFAAPAAPVQAIVVTIPPEVILRILLLAASDT